MSYVRKKKTYRLKFPHYEGLEIQMKGLTIRELTGSLLHLAEVKKEDAKEEDFTELLDLFASKLIDWNMVDEDNKPIPATREAMDDEEFDFILEIIYAWLDAVIGVDSPLKQTSSVGDQHQEPPTPKATL